MKKEPPYHRKRHVRSMATEKLVFAIGGVIYRQTKISRACRRARDKNNPATRKCGKRVNACTPTRAGRNTHVKIDTRICATANFIFSNRDLRLPQASAPPPPPSRCTATADYFFPRESIFPPPRRPRPPLHPRENLFCRVPAPFWYFKRRKRKKRYLYESVFLRRLFLLVSSNLPPACFSSSSSGISWRLSTPFVGDRNEGGKWLTFRAFPADNALASHAHVYM